MVLPLARMIAVTAVCAAPLFASATVYQFNASLNAANEVGTPSSSTATGVATLFYNDFGTVSLTDDTYDFSLSVFGLEGGATAGTAASAAHIHGPAMTTANAGVVVPLTPTATITPPFVSFNAGSVLLIGGAGVAPPPTAPMSFLDMLKGGLTYVNVHTALNPGGAVRGQLLQVAAVTAVPEPETYALMLAGLGLVGGVVARRRKAAASR